MEKVIGFLSFRESLPDAVIEEINSRKIDGVRAEHCIVCESRMAQFCPYSVIIDRVSHIVTYYRTYLKNAALSGTYVINNPFWFLADDKFYNYSLATRLGIAVPRTICLPSRSYPSGTDEDDLRNLTDELDWDSIVDYVGLPAILKPYDGYGWRHVYKVSTMGELFEKYDESGEMVMVLQQFIDYEHYVRCFVFGQKYVLPIRYDPSQPFGGKQYIVDHEHLTPELGARIVDECVKINKALGYDMNTVEFAIKEGIPYALDFMNPIPDTEPGRISNEYFRWVVKTMADVAIEYALEGKRTIDIAAIREKAGLPPHDDAFFAGMEDAGSCRPCDVLSSKAETPESGSREADAPESGSPESGSPEADAPDGDEAVSPEVDGIISSEADEIDEGGKGGPEKEYQTPVMREFEGG